MLADNFFLPRFRQDALRGTRLIQHIDSLVRQVAVVDEARGKFRRAGQCRRAVFDAVVLLETRPQAAQDRNGLFH
jgi:hypothetical protein